MSLSFDIVSTILFNIMDVYLFYRLFNQTLTFRFQKKWLFPIYLGAYCMHTLFILEDLFPFPLLKLCGMLGFLLIIFFIHSDSIWKRLLWVASAYILLALCELIAIPLVCLVTHIPFEEVTTTPISFCLGMVLSRSLYFIVTNFLARFKYGKKKVFEGFSKEISVILLVDLIYMMILANLFYFNAILLDIETAIGLSLLILVVISALSIYLLQKVMKKSEEIMNTTLRLQQAEMEHKLTSDMTSVVEDLRSLRHDMNNHMSVLQGLLSVKAYEDMEAYLNSITQELTVANNFYFPENKVLSVLLNSKISQASQLGISFETEIKTSSTPFSERDLCTLIGNIIENALEASSAHSNPYIYFAMYQEKQTLHIKCNNTYTTEPIFENGKLLTTKENKTTHGIGTQNIRSVVEAYQGTLQFSVDDQFHVAIKIPI